MPFITTLWNESVEFLRLPIRGQKFEFAQATRAVSLLPPLAT